MAKQTQIDKAIANLEAEIAVLQLAINKLKAQQTTKAAPRKAKSTAREALREVTSA